jgi:type IV secretory pathway TraG/TraD family ATPase VirD4
MWLKARIVAGFLVNLALYAAAAWWVWQRGGTGPRVGLWLMVLGTSLALPVVIYKWRNRHVAVLYEEMEPFATVGCGNDERQLVRRVFKPWSVHRNVGQIGETLAGWALLAIGALLFGFGGYWLQPVWPELSLRRAAFLGAALMMLGWYEQAFRTIPVESEPDAERPDDHGTARPATVREVRNPGGKPGDVTEDLRHALWMGLDPEHPRHPALGYSGELSAITIGAPGTSKFASAVCPTLLTFEGTAVVFDPKAQAASVTGPYRTHSMRHRVVYFNPGNDPAVPGPPASCNPFADMDPTSPLFESRVRTLAQILQPIDPHEHSKFFSGGARGLIGAVSLHLRTTEGQHATLPMLSDKLFQADPQLDAMFVEMAASHVPAVRNCGRRFSNSLHIQSAKDIVQTARGSVEFLSDGVMRALFSNGPSCFSWKQLKSDRVTVYIVFSPELAKAYGQAIEVLFSLALNVALEKPKAPCLFLIDEFANALPRRGVAATALLNAFAYGRDNGVRIWAFFQSWAQIVSQFEEENDFYTMLSAGGMLQCFGAGTGDGLTAEKISELSGMETIFQTVDPGKTQQTFPGDKPQRNSMGRRLVDPKAVRELVGNGGQILWIAKVANPLLSMKRLPAYFDIPWLKERAGKDPFH